MISAWLRHRATGMPVSDPVTMPGTWNADPEGFIYRDDVVFHVTRDAVLAEVDLLIDWHGRDELIVADLDPPDTRLKARGTFRVSRGDMVVSPILDGPV